MLPGLEVLDGAGRDAPAPLRTPEQQRSIAAPHGSNGERSSDELNWEIRSRLAACGLGGSPLIPPAAVMAEENGDGYGLSMAIMRILGS